MTELAKSDIFFFITSTAVIVLTIVVLVVLYYIVKILRDVEDITESVKEESKNIIEDVSFIRRSVKRGAKKVSSVIRPSSYTKKNKKK